MHLSLTITAISIFFVWIIIAYYISKKRLQGIYSKYEGNSKKKNF